MKNVFFAFFALCLMACSTNSMVVQVPAKQSVEIDMPQYEMYEAQLKNKSLKGLEIRVLDKNTAETVRAFGLGTKGKEEVMVEANSKLQLTNNTNTSARLAITFTEKSPSSLLNTDTPEYVNFTLANPSAKSIPLLIPSVMNPNLSPFSESGVGLKVGQKILFKEGGKKRVLLVVNENIKEGEIIDVPSLLKERRAAIGGR